MSEHTEQEQPSGKTRSSNGKLAFKLLGAAIGMFGFGFALVPLYDVICDITGLNGKTGGRYEYDAAVAEIDTDRLVTVQFMANNNDGMSWEFYPVQKQVKVHPGELTEVTFYARNPSSSAIIGQAVPSVSPYQAADYMHKTECFCFTQQSLEGGQEVQMPLQFFIDQDIPEEITKLTLSYSLFDVTENFKNTSSVLTAN